MQSILGITVRVVAGVLLVFGAGACRSYESRLRPERLIPELHELAVAYEAQPKDIERITVMAPGEDGEDTSVEIAVHETGIGDKERLLVMVHGVLADSRTWRYMAADLANEYDVWAVDMPGCGESDAPNHFELAPDAYSPDWLARLVLDALRQRLQMQAGERESPPQITLVGHSLGGGVLLRMLGSEDLASTYGDVLGLVDSAVLLAPLDFGYPKADPQFLEMAELSDTMRMAAISTGQLRRLVAEAIYKGCFYPDRVPVNEFEHVWDAVFHLAKWHAAQAMLKRAGAFDKDAKKIWRRAKPLIDDYDNVGVPCLLVWGAQDETLPAMSGDSLANHLPLSWLRTIDECKHCLPTEEPRLCIDLVRQFLATVPAEREKWDPHAHLERPPSPDAEPERGSLRIPQEVEVATGSSAPIAEAPSTVTVLRGEDLQRSGARHLADALRLVPGAEVQRLSSTEAGVSFRGYADSALPAQGVLGLVDGRQVQNPFIGNTLWDQLAVRLEDIEQVEVIRGVGSFLHGPNAMHGVVSIETRSPLDYEKSTVSSSAAFGSPGSNEIGATVVHVTDNTGFKISTKWDDLGQFDEAVVGQPGGGRDKMFFDLGYEVELDGDPGHVLGFQGGVSNQQFDLLLPSFFGGAIPAARLDSQMREGYTQMRYRRGDPARRVFELRAGWTTFDFDSTPTAIYQPFSTQIDTFDVDARGTWRGEASVLVAGAGYRLSTFGTRDFDVTAGQHEVHEGWLFAQDDFELTEDLSLTLGARVDVHSRTDESVSPRAAMVWQAVDDHYLRLSVGRGFRNPSLRELWFEMPLSGTGITIRGDRDLDPERLTSYEAGWFGSWGGDADERRFEVGVTAFHNRFDDMILYLPTPGTTNEAAPQNGAGEEVYGVEVEGRLVLRDRLSAFGSYAWIDRHTSRSLNQRTAAAMHKGNLGFSYTGDRVEAMLWAHYYGESAMLDRDIDDYVLLSGSLSYRFDLSAGADGRLFVRAFNLLDNVHREHPEGDEYGLLLSAGVQFRW